ncbi:TonB-dependent receptor domain-containing protein [Tsuneonella troitsensis]|uniref:TonB-dependent receptor domain-containing protein n=1 Tax=Tsuneonella troitsensis TaxID=292222 RepID=UPI00070A8369|nr:TonB-dependent receptor [Tsuneonella troitsensis]
MNTQKVVKFLVSSSAVSLALIGSSVQANAQEIISDQDGTAVDATGEEVAEGSAIVVTGSRIARPEADSPNPVTSIDAQTIQQSGLTNLTDLLVQNPALIASSTTSDAGGSTALFGGVGINLLNLRNLGTDRTLVLVNGRRHIAGISGSAAVDINTIPNALVERIDVLTGGVSAVYGADGVSGVVNFVLKRDFEGFDARFQSGISSRGDAGNIYASATAGTNFADDRGNLAVNYEYNREARVPGFARSTGRVNEFCSLIRNPLDFPDSPTVFDRVETCNLRYADSSTNGAVDANIDFVPDFQGNGLPYDRGQVLPQSGGLAIGGDSTPLAGYQGDLSPRTEKHNVNVLGSFEFSPAFRFFVEGKYVKTKNFSFAQPSFDFFTTIQADNPFIPAPIRNSIVFGPGGLDDFGLPAGVLVSRDNFDLGTRGEYAERDTYRGVAGFDGEISPNARYEVSYVYGQTKTDFLATNYRIADRYFAALDAVDEGLYRTGIANGNIVCRSNLDPNAPDNDPNAFLIGAATSPLTFTPGANSGCVPLNILGEGVASQAALDWINADLQNSVKLQQHVVSGSISGDFGALFELPGGPIGFALGAEYRKEKSTYVSDPLQRIGALADLAQIQDEQGEFDVKEGFAELNVPLFRNAPFADILQFGAAIRLSDYSTVGKTTTWKADGTWGPIPDIRFRATYSEAVRAPNITELFSPQNGTFAFIDDPCDPTNIPEGTQFRQANCTALLTALGVNPATFSPTSDPRATVSLPGRSGGNPNLEEETATTWTAGVVLRPRFIPRLTITADWYDIKLENAISTAAAQDLVDLCVDQPTLDNQFCANIGRDSTTGFVNDFLVGPANVAQFRTAGADFTVNYTFAPSQTLGNFNLRLAGGYLDRLEFIPTPGAELDNDRTEANAPKWNGTLDLTWQKDNFSVNYGVNYFSKTRRYTTEQIEANPDLVDPKFIFFREKWEHDVQLGWTTDDERFRFYTGVNNIFDRLPDLGQLGYPSSFRGRYIYAGARINFDRIPGF